MRLTLLEKIQLIFARDKDGLFWRFITDEELELKRMDAWQLATVIHEESVHQTLPQKKIVAEHLLSVRLVKLQNRAVMVAAVFGIAGAVIGAFATSIFQSSAQSMECVNQQNASANPNSAAADAGKHTIAKPAVNPKAVEPPDRNGAQNQSGAK